MSRIEGRVSVVVGSSGILCSDQHQSARTMAISWDQTRGITSTEDYRLISWVGSPDNVIMCGFR